MANENSAVSPAGGKELPLWLAALAALLFCAGECLYGYSSGSGDVLRGGFDWLYDVFIYGLAAVSLGRARIVERRVAFILLAIFIVGGFEGAHDVWAAVLHPGMDDDGGLVPDMIDVSGCATQAMMIIPFRRSRDPVLGATWLSARNSVLSSFAGALVTIACETYALRWPRIAIFALESLLAFQAAFVVASDLQSETSDL